MRRRTFLFATGATAAGAAAVWRFGLENGASHSDRGTPPSDAGEAAALANDRARAVHEAAARARSVGKPLLVLVIPQLAPDPEWREVMPRFFNLQRLFGAWLNHCGDEALADVMLTEPVCAGLADLATEFPQAREVRATTPWVLVDVASGAMRVPPPEADRVIRSERYGPDEADIAAFVLALRNELRGEPERLQALVNANRTALGEARVTALTAHLSQGSIYDQDLLEAGAAVALAWWIEKERRPTPVVGILAARAQTRYVEAPIPGSRWANSDGGCGADIEGDPEPKGLTIQCGMGHVPRLSHRFLYLWST